MPIDLGIDPFNWLLLRYLNVNKHYNNGYLIKIILNSNKWVSFVSLPIDDGIDPCNSDLQRFLDFKISFKTQTQK